MTLKETKEMWEYTNIDKENKEQLSFNLNWVVIEWYLWYSTILFKYCTHDFRKEMFFLWEYNLVVAYRMYMYVMDSDS